MRGVPPTHAGRDRDMVVETDAPAGDVTPWELGYLDDGDDALGAPEPARLPTPSTSRTVPVRNTTVAPPRLSR